MYSITPRVTQAHTQSHTRSQSHGVPHGFGGSGRAPGGSYVNALTAPLLAPPHPPPASSCSASARGCLAGAREQLGLAEAPGAEKPDPTQPQAEPGRGTQSTPPNTLRVQLSPPETTHTHPGTASRPHLQHSLQTPFWNPVICIAT